MDWAYLIVGVLAFIGTLITTIVLYNRTTTLLNYRIDQLEKKVDSHAELIQKAELNQKDIKHIYYELTEIKNNIKELSK